MRANSILPNADKGRVLWDVTQEIMAKAGLPAYEISNHARPGGESRHNLIYWRYGEYVGVGPGAHGRIKTAKGRRAQSTEQHPEMWLTVVETDGHGACRRRIALDGRAGRRISADGPAADRRHRADRASRRSPAAALIRSASPRSSKRAWSNIRRRRLRVSPEGFPLLDAVVADLAA